MSHYQGFFNSTFQMLDRSAIEKPLMMAHREPNHSQTLHMFRLSMSHYQGFFNSAFQMLDRSDIGKPLMMAHRDPKHV
jgi:hypothetical protein